MKRLRPLFFLHRIRSLLAYTQIVPPDPLAVYFPCLPLSAINGRLAGKRNTLFIPYPSLSSPVNTVNEPTRLPKEESGKAMPCFCLCVHAKFSRPPCIGCRISMYNLLLHGTCAVPQKTEHGKASSVMDKSAHALTVRSSRSCTSILLPWLQLAGAPFLPCHLTMAMFW